MQIQVRDRIAAAIAAHPALAALFEESPHTADIHAPNGVRPFLALLSPAPVVLVTATAHEAESLAEELSSLMTADDVTLYPAWETLPHERLSPRSDTVGQRLATLRRLVHGPVPRVVVLPVRSLLQPQVKGLADLVPVTVATGQAISLTTLVEALAKAAYVRVDLVTSRGEFAVRGGIVDVFPVTGAHPVRIDFFGDVVDEIREFHVADQRSMSAIDAFTASPCRELILTEEVRERANQLKTDHPALADILGRIAEGIAVEGMESLAPILVPDMEFLSDLLPHNTTLILSNPERIRARAEELVATSQEFLSASWMVAASAGQAPIDLGGGAFQSLDHIGESALARGLHWWRQGTIGLSDQAIDIAAIEPPEFRGDLTAAIRQIRTWLDEQRAVIITVPGEGQAQRTVEWLAENDIPASHHSDAPANVVSVQIAELDHGLVLGQLALLTYEDLVGQRTAERANRTVPQRRMPRIDPLELKSGDVVVHEQHGVGRYLELVRRTTHDAEREYLVIEYAPSKRGHPPDRLFVPMDQLDQVSRYIGGENPSLDKLGGTEWSARKSKARRAVRKIASELIALYAARQSTPGHAFAPDTPWQRELEDSFSFVETPDQLITINEVKADMEQPVPMDRLVCGDVGFGKTEIAVRAAFKAIQDGKQVLLLVPTTLLVQQHYETFASRFGQFPVTLKALSRFQTEKEAATVMSGLADGSIDMVIGTHRLLQPGVQVKNLGLVIVDEEQRFGVEHKERLKQVRAAVDFLAMSATPIPRTLEMAITGIREMSIIQTPPEDRHPILSFVGPYDNQQIMSAIRRELLREGQVFYIHNRVQSINKAAERLRELVPEARVAVAHGQMGEAALEQAMLDFWQRKFDVLVCTTIVESGLDVSNANTMIIERADLLGLSQLHQLRGRVGRSRERAYAYFMYPPDKPLNETAHERLTTIATHNELGGGMAVAMKDLEIRGAGNLLGGEQSGHIADVGFDLYIRLVGEAVLDAKGTPQIDREMKLEIPVEAHLPNDYVESERLRLEIYQRLAGSENHDDVDRIREELVDRFGELPTSAELLLEVARLRVDARQAQLKEISVAGSKVRFLGTSLPESSQLRLARIYPGSIYKSQSNLVIIPRPKSAEFGGEYVSGTELLDWVKQIVVSIFS